MSVKLESASALLRTTDATEQQTFASLLSRKDIDETSVLGDFLTFFDTSPPPRISFENVKELSPVAFRAFFRAAGQCNYQCETFDFSPLNFTDETWLILMKNIHHIQGVKTLVLTEQPEARILLMLRIDKSFFSGITRFELGGDKRERLEEGVLGFSLSTLLKEMPRLEVVALDNFTLNESDLSTILSALNQETLHSLSLRDNSLTEASLAHFTNSVKLKQLNLANNRIKTLTPSFLQWMLGSTLKKLDISFNNVEQEEWGDICDKLLDSTVETETFDLHLFPQNPEYDRNAYQDLYNSLNAFNITANCGVYEVESSRSYVLDPLNIFMHETVVITQEWVNRVNEFLRNPEYSNCRNQILEWALMTQYEILPIEKDGNDLFASAAAQLGNFPQKLLRTLVIYWMYTHFDDYEKLCDGHFMEHLEVMAMDGESGTEVEIRAIADYLGPTFSFEATSSLRLVGGKLLPSENNMFGDLHSDKPPLYLYNAVDDQDNTVYWSGLHPKDGARRSQISTFPTITSDSLPFRECLRNFMVDTDSNEGGAVLLLWVILHLYDRENEDLLCLNDGNRPIVCQSPSVVTAITFMLFAENALTTELDISGVEFSPECWSLLQKNVSMFHSLTVLGCSHNNETSLTRWLPFLSIKRTLDLSDNSIRELAPLHEVYRGLFAPSLDVRDNKIPFSELEKFLDSIISQKRTEPYYNEVRVRVGMQCGKYIPSEQAVKIGPFLTFYGIANDLMRYIPDDHNIIGLPDEVRHVLNDIFLAEKIGASELSKINSVLNQDVFATYRSWIVVHLLKRFFVIQEDSNEKHDIISLVLDSPDWDFLKQYMADNWAELNTEPSLTPDQVLAEMKEDPKKHNILFFKICAHFHKTAFIVFDDHCLFTIKEGVLYPTPLSDNLLDPVFIYHNRQGECYILEPKEG